MVLYKLYFINKNEFSKLRGNKFERTTLKKKHTDDDVIKKLNDGYRVFDLVSNEINSRVVDLLIKHDVLITTDYPAAKLLQIFSTNDYVKHGVVEKVTIDENEDGEIVTINPNKIVDIKKQKRVRIQVAQTQKPDLPIIKESSILVDNQTSTNNIDKGIIKEEKINVVEEKSIQGESELIENIDKSIDKSIVVKECNLVDPKSTNLQIAISERLSEEFIDYVSAKMKLSSGDRILIQIIRKQLIDIIENLELFNSLGYNKFIFSHVVKITEESEIIRTNKGIYYVKSKSVKSDSLIVFTIMSQDILFNEVVKNELNEISYLINVVISAIAELDKEHADIEDKISVTKNSKMIIVN